MAVAAIHQLVAGFSSSAEMGPRVTRLMDPWIAFAEEVVGRLVSGTTFEGLLPVKDVAYAAIALYACTLAVSVCVVVLM